MSDRYVIVYRDGKQSALISKDLADNALPSLMNHPHVSKRPAYRLRIRIREKAMRHWSDGLTDKQVQWVNEVSAIHWD